MCATLAPPAANKCVSTIDTPGENINIEWSPNGQLLAVGNKVRMAVHPRTGNALVVRVCVT